LLLFFAIFAPFAVNFSCMKRILILMSKTGGGHLASAEALQAVFAEVYGAAAHVTIVDLLMDYLPWPLSELPKSYSWMANRAPWLWGTLWRSGQRRWLAQGIMRPLSRTSVVSVMLPIVQHQPDLVVSVHPLVQEPALFALRRLRETIPYTIVVTDLASVHPLWYHRQAARCYVASEAAYQGGIAAGLRPEQLRLFGLPVRPVFATTPRPRPVLRAELGMHATLPAVLLVGGGEGIGRVAEIAQACAAALAAADTPAGQMVVICGRNRRLESALSQVAWPIPVQVRGFVTNMSDWMAACDCIVTKAGPGTIAEALIRGLPILLSGFIPGQEEGNVPYVLENEVGVFAQAPGAIARQVHAWFGPDRAELARMAENARRLGNPRSTYEIVADLASLIDLARPAAAGPIPSAG
jgi:1,2-diacylglycerol 3-beta-galactosyltransferase